MFLLIDRINNQWYELLIFYINNNYNIKNQNIVVIVTLLGALMFLEQARL